MLDTDVNVAEEPLQREEPPRRGPVKPGNIGNLLGGRGGAAAETSDIKAVVRFTLRNRR